MARLWSSTVKWHGFPSQRARISLEAAYFYNGMLAHRTNSVVFPYYLSAFVSALRSVTYYLQKQYAHRPTIRGVVQRKARSDEGRRSPQDVA